MTDAPDKTAPRWRKWLLTGSLALNLLLLGLVAGAALREDDREPPRNTAIRGPVDSLQHMYRSLPDPHRTAIREEMRTREADFRSTREAFGALREEMFVVLVEDPIDQARLEALLDEQVRLMQGTTRKGQQIFVKTILGMSLSEREEFVENLRTRPRVKRDRPGGRETQDRD